MIRTKQQGLHQSLLTAVEANTETIVSAVKKVEWMDPLLFYAAGKQLGCTERFYWSDTSQRVILAGVGSAFTIANSSQKRFQDARAVWNKLLRHMIVHRPDYEFGTGPLLFGGFAFDPLKQRTELWNTFSDTVLWLPSFMLTLKDGEAWLTVNQLVAKDDDAEALHEKLLETEQLLMQYSKRPLAEQAVSFLRQHEIEPEEWMKSIKSVQEEMEQGKVQKVVLAREMQLTADAEVDSASVLQALRIGQPDCYIFSIDYKGLCFLGATPERLIQKENNVFTSMCLAGSIGRGKTPEEDKKNGEELLYDEKNLAEHGYVVNMIRGVMDELCEEVSIPYKPGLMKTKHLLHLHTPVKGKGTCDLLKMVEELHPTPALGGTPRDEALQLIRDHELLDRGFYGAPIGWIDYEGNGEFAVGLRSGLLKGTNVSLFAGCGIVEDSKPESEYEETKMKFKPMLTALGGNTT
ncbi:isochorismate synthase [Ectobacillus panaciterrae]|uniref:isochorismate synthase n=1 Tax=Ectobacillus panaciterrae TaxID=363872 RepID=UPI00040D2190|nr:isochorismate synthase [Ectobacillus panaciterrae]